jgi:hypothetical protein
VYLDLLEEAEASLLGKATTGCMFHDPAGKHVVDRTKHTGSNPFTGEGCSDKWRRYKLMRGWMCACVLGMCLLLEGPALKHPVNSNATMWIKPGWQAWTRRLKAFTGGGGPA